MNVRELIDQAIKTKGVSQYRVAVEAGVDRAFLNQVLAGKKPISNDLIDKVAPVLDLDAEQLKALADVERLGPEGVGRLRRYVLEQSLALEREAVAEVKRLSQELATDQTLSEEMKRKILEEIKLRMDQVNNEIIQTITDETIFPATAEINRQAVISGNWLDVLSNLHEALASHLDLSSDQIASIMEEALREAGSNDLEKFRRVFTEKLLPFQQKSESSHPDALREREALTVFQSLPSEEQEDVLKYMRWRQSQAHQGSD